MDSSNGISYGPKLDKRHFSINRFNVSRILMKLWRDKKKTEGEIIHEGD